MIPPREVPPRDDYYMGMAFFAAGKSKDPRTRVGAYIVNAENKPLGSGYNGPPSEIKDEEINWDRPHKYPYIKHAEDNAIDHSDRPQLKGATLYVTAMPCVACMLDIVAAKIHRVVYFQPNNVDPGSMLARLNEIEQTKDIARKGNVILEQFSGSLQWVKDHVGWMTVMGAFMAQSVTTSIDKA